MVCYKPLPINLTVNFTIFSMSPGKSQISGDSGDWFVFSESSVVLESTVHSLQERSTKSSEDTVLFSC